MITVSNAVIESAIIDIGDRGCLTAWLTLDYGGAGQCFGGYALYLPKSWTHHEKNAGYAGHFLYRVMEIAGVDQWHKLPGKTIRVRKTWSKIEAIGHIVKDDWFDPDKDFQPKEGPHADIPSNESRPERAEVG